MLFTEANAAVAERWLIAVRQGEQPAESCSWGGQGCKLNSDGTAAGGDTTFNIKCILANHKAGKRATMAN